MPLRVRGTGSQAHSTSSTRQEHRTSRTVVYTLQGRPEPSVPCAVSRSKQPNTEQTFNSFFYALEDVSIRIHARFHAARAKSYPIDEEDGLKRGCQMRGGTR